MLKRFIAIILCVCMMPLTALAANFSDVAGHWAESEISYAVENGMVSGYGDGTFKPNKTVSRAEFVKMLVASICENLQIEIPKNADGAHWVSEYYNFAKENGIVVPQPEVVCDGVGVGDLTGKTADYPIKRWEMAYILYCVIYNVFVIRGDNNYSFYNDFDETQQLYGEDLAIMIGVCIKNDLLEGDQNGNFNATKNTTRAEGITVVNRVDRKIKRILELKSEERIENNQKTYDEIPTGHPRVEFTMEKGGKFIVELYPEYAPQTVANFVALAESGFYDGLTFHRIIKGFVAQGGDPNGDGTGDSDGFIKGEFSENGFDKNTLKHERGTISMARGNHPDSASCQFFICYEDQTSLDGNYAAFGKVIEGMEVVDSFLEEGEGELEDGEQLVPKEEIVIKEVKIKK